MRWRCIHWRKAVALWLCEKAFARDVTWATAAAGSTLKWTWCRVGARVDKTLGARIGRSLVNFLDRFLQTKLVRASTRQGS